MGALSQEFISEAEDILGALNRELFQLDNMAGGEAFNPETVNSIFRGAHSLKGLAGMFGFIELQEFSHRLENLLDSLRLGRVKLGRALVDTLFRGSELLKSLVDAKASGQSLPSTAPLLAEIDRLMSAGPAEEILSPAVAAGIDPEMVATLSEYEEHRLNENVRSGKLIHKVTAVFDLSTFDTALGELIEAAKTKGEVITTLPSGATSTADQIAFDVIVGTAISREELATLLEKIPGLAVSTLGHHTGAAPSTAQSLDGAQGLSASTPSGSQDERSVQAEDRIGSSARSASQTVRVHINKLDHLMNIVGDLVIQKSDLQRISDRLKAIPDLGTASADLEKSIRSYGRRINELQTAVMSTRLVPIGTIFERMATIIRQTSRSLGKEVQIEMAGMETELDKLIIEELSDPLMHIVRNAVDHGLEIPTERTSVGKPTQGTVRLHAYPEGNKVIVQISDDGRGIDAENVYKKALSLGLVSADQPYTTSDKLDMIFLPGLSTKSEVSDLSGRGVGMDVVKNNIARLSGMIQLDSRSGEGTKVTLTLPITLAIIKALLVETRGRTYAVPIYNVLECVRVTHERIRTIEKKATFELRGRSVPLIDLADYLQHQGEIPESSFNYIIVVGLAEQRLGIKVDMLSGQQDVVIKPLGTLLKMAPGVAGAAELGNQKTVLVLDIGRILGDVMLGSHGGERAA